MARGPISEEQKAKMRVGREAAAKRRKEEAARAAELDPGAPSAEYFPPPRPVMPDPEQPEPEPIDEPGELSGFQHFVASLDADTLETLSSKDLRDIWDAQVAKAEAEKKAARKRAAADRALVQARINAGIIPAQTADDIRVERRNAEMVTLRVNLPEGGGPGIYIDQQCYLHGFQYTVRRAVADVLLDQQSRCWKAEALFKGLKSTFFDEMRGAYVDPWSGGRPVGMRSYHAGSQ